MDEHDDTTAPANTKNVERENQHSNNVGNESSLKTIYSFISNYVLKEEIQSDDEIENKYQLLEEDIENQNNKIVTFPNENSTDEESDEHEEPCKTSESELSNKKKKRKKTKEHEKRKPTIKKDKRREEIARQQKSISKGKHTKNKTKIHNDKENSQSNRRKNNTKQQTEYYIEPPNEDHHIKKQLTNFSKYFTMSIQSFNEDDIFTDEKKLNKQMSYYNDAYYYTSEMIYKDNKKSKEKFALYLRVISLFLNIIVGIYLITHFPHTNNNVEVSFANKQNREHEKMKDNIRHSIEIGKNTFEGLDHITNNYTMSSKNNEEEITSTKSNKSFFNYLFSNYKQEEENVLTEEQHNKNLSSNKSERNDVLINHKKNTLGKNEEHENGIVINQNKLYDIKENDSTNIMKEINLSNLFNDEDIIRLICMEMNKIYEYVIYSFFGELIVTSIFLFSLFILRVLIKDVNRFNVILTIYGMLYKLFCYFFAHYVLIMGIYILSIYYNIYKHKDNIYDNSFLFFCYHYVCNNLFLHMLMWFYAFQNIIFTINDMFNSIRIFFILLKHIMVKIYDKITCKSFITFYEINEDPPLLAPNCMGISKSKYSGYSKINCCKDKSCADVDREEEMMTYNNTQNTFEEALQHKPYRKHLDIKMYEQSLLNMRNPFK